MWCSRDAFRVQRGEMRAATGSPVQPVRLQRPEDRLPPRAPTIAGTTRVPRDLVTCVAGGSMDFPPGPSTLPRVQRPVNLPRRPALRWHTCPRPKRRLPAHSSRRQRPRGAGGRSLARDPGRGPEPRGLAAPSRITRRPDPAAPRAAHHPCRVPRRLAGGRGVEATATLAGSGPRPGRPRLDGPTRLRCHPVRPAPACGRTLGRDTTLKTSPIWYPPPESMQPTTTTTHPATRREYAGDRVVGFQQAESPHRTELLATGNGEFR